MTLTPSSSSTRMTRINGTQAVMTFFMCLVAVLTGITLYHFYQRFRERSRKKPYAGIPDRPAAIVRPTEPEPEFRAPQAVTAQQKADASDTLQASIDRLARMEPMAGFSQPAYNGGYDPVELENFRKAEAAKNQPRANGRFVRKGQSQSPDESL